MCSSPPAVASVLAIVRHRRLLRPRFDPERHATKDAPSSPQYQPPVGRLSARMVPAERPRPAVEPAGCPESEGDGLRVLQRSLVVGVLAVLALAAMLLGMMMLAGHGEDRTPTARETVVVAVGDIACSASMEVTPDSCQHEAVSDLAMSQSPAALLTLGDNQYPEGELEDFRDVFDRTFGRMKGLIRPVIGNHEYNDDRGGAAGYFDYFNGVGVDAGLAGSRTAPYYSFDLGPWHLIALDSECEAVPGACGADSPQRLWLLEDLAAHPSRCTLAYWHRPRFAAGTAHEGEVELGVLWNDLVDAEVDVLLAAHNHNAEVMDPIGLTPPDSLVPVSDRDGLQQFTVGTGGAHHDAFVGPPLRASDGSAVTTARSHATFGVLRLVLKDGSYDWSFLGIDGSAFNNADSSTAGAFHGSRRCR
jgi:acid phosphatase type 7